jgi:hypothetical protein
MIGPPPSAKAGSAVSDCSCPPPEQPPTDQPCKHSTLKISCSHKGRNVSVSADGPAQSKSQPQNQSLAPPSPLALSQQATLQVVAGYSDSPDKITCDTVIQAVCDSCVNKVFDLDPLKVSNDKGSTLIKNTSSQLLFNARSYELDSFRKKFWPWDESPRTYQIDTHTHDGVPLTGYVEAFSDIQWKPEAAFTVELTAGSDASKKKKGVWDTFWDFFSALDNAPEPKITLGLENFSWKYDGVPRSIDAKLDKKLKETLKCVNIAADILQFFIELLAQLVGAKITLKSKVTLSGNWQWEEIAGSPNVGSAGSIAVDFDPLIGVDSEWDVTEGMLAVLSKWPPATPICESLLRLKRAGELAEEKLKKLEESAKAKKGPSNYAGGFVTGGIKLIVGGAIKFKLNWEKKAAESKWKGLAPDSSGGANVSVEIKAVLKGKGLAKYKWFKISMSAEVTGAAKCGFKAEEIAAIDTAKGPGIGCKIIWEGITLSFIAKGDGNVTYAPSDAATDSEAGGFDKKASYSQHEEDGDLTKGEVKETKKIGGSVESNQAGGFAEYSLKYNPEFLKARTWNHTDEGEKPLGLLYMLD